MRTPLLLLGILFYHLTFPQAGTLDLSFSGDGKLVWDVTESFDELYAVTVQPDGKIIGVGWAEIDGYNALLLQRLMEDGSPDQSFGSGPMSVVSIPGQFLEGYAVDLQSTGKIVVAGRVDGPGGPQTLLARFTENGQPDVQFGNNGLLYLDLGGSPGYSAGWAMQVMPDDRIVIAGEASGVGLTVARLSADGGFDPNYGTNGIASTSIAFSAALCLDLFADGSVVAGGYSYLNGNNWYIARFDPNGDLDPAFGDAGIVTTDLNAGDAESMRGVAILSDGRIAACGYRTFFGQDDEPVIGMYASDGTLDTDFADQGLLIMEQNSPFWAHANAIEVMDDDKLLIAGFRVLQGSSGNNDFMLLRLLDDGSFDPTFAGGGEVYTDISGTYDRAHAMALTPDGSIVLAGFGYEQQSATAYARYLNDAVTAISGSDQPGSGLALYPVPARDHLFISSDQQLTGETQISIRGVDGKITMDRSVLLNEVPATIDISALAAGVYFIEVTAGERSYQEKFIVE